jgi:trimeric autotransporter adhesin
MTMLQAQLLLLIVVRDVGIGTTSVGSELHVVADDVSQSWSAYDGTVLTIENNDTDGCILQTVGRNTATNEIWFGDDDSRNIGRIRYEHSDDGLEFWTNNSERMRIDSSGNVGIGTSSPSANLEVRGASSNGQIYLGGSTTATYGQIL